MKKPSLIEGVGVAVLLAFATAVLCSFTFFFFFGGGAVLVPVILSYVYVLYLLTKRGPAPGRTSLAIAAFSVLAGITVVGSSALMLLLVCIAVIWTVRTLLYARSITSAALHAGLCILGFAAGEWAFWSTQSVTVAVWSFFLMQALFVFIPSRFSKDAARARFANAVDRSEFEVARHAAEEALERLIGAARV